MRDMRRMQRYYTHEPFGFAMDERRHAIAIATQWRTTPYKGPPSLKDPDHWIYKHAQKQTADDVYSNLKAAFPMAEKRIRRYTPDPRPH